MSQHPEIVSSFDWRLLIAVLALLLAVFNLWYSAFRKGKLSFVSSRWTAVGIDVSGKTGAVFALKIDVINNGSKSIQLTDLLLEAKLQDGTRIFYDPIFLFDLTTYIGSMGNGDRIAKSQKGMAPLPAAIPAGKQFDFGFELLFMPHDKRTAIQIATDTPVELNLYSLSDRDKNYTLVATQEISTEDIKSLTNGGFAGVLSTSSIKNRDKLINTVAK